MSRMLFHFVIFFTAACLSGCNGNDDDELETDDDSGDDDDDNDSDDGDDDIIGDPVGYDDFPPELQQSLDEAMAELEDTGGVFVAGKVSYDDGTEVGGEYEVMVNIWDSLDEPMLMYYEGWFMMIRVISGDWLVGDQNMIVRSFHYEPIDVDVNVLANEVTYVHFVMQTPPAGELSTIKGVVVDRDDEPISGATVRIDFPFANFGIGSYPDVEMFTGSDGRFELSDVVSVEYSVGASKEGYMYHYENVFLPKGDTVEVVRRLLPPKKITIEYVYQPDGSTDFTTEEVITDTLEWTAGEGGVDFSDGKIEEYEPDSLRDLELRQEQEELFFRNFYVNGKNGFYDAGETDLESITEAETSGYDTLAVPCLKGHVYVVKTYEEDHYAKFAVTDIEEL